MSHILYVGDLTSGTRSEQRLRALRDLGHTVVGIPVVRPRRDAQSYPRPRLVDRIARKLGRPIDRAGTNERILRKVDASDFDALWIERGLTVTRRTLEAVRAMQPELELIAFSEDDLALRHNQSRTWRDALELYDLVVTTKRRNLEPDELPFLGAERVHYEPKTFDPSFHYPRALDGIDVDRVGGDVGFVGTFERERAELCLALAESGVDVRVFGHGWERWRGRHPKLQVEGRTIGGDEYALALSATRIQLGFLRRQNRDRHTDRSVEIPACGGFLLAERTDEHLMLFDEDREAVYFGDPPELVAKVAHYLAHEDERRAIAEAGLARCWSSDYSHHGACARILALVGVPAPVPPRTAAEQAASRARGVTPDVEQPPAALAAERTTWVVRGGRLA